jgi:serine phosphatase RsbU (regulator of sigma subunit)
MLVVGDVAGHGAEAAALTALARWTLRSTSELTRDPGRAVRQLNATLRDLPQLSLCTTVCAHVRTRAGDGEATVTLANGGHPRPLLVRDGHVEELGRVGPMAGAFDDGGWDCTEVALHGGDALVLYTDGVLDTVGERDRFGAERLRATLEAAAAASEQPGALVARLAAELEAFRRGPQRDDTAIAAVRFVGRDGVGA